jgi:hypothetical protein
MKDTGASGLGVSRNFGLNSQLHSMPIEEKNVSKTPARKASITEVYSPKELVKILFRQNSGGIQGYELPKEQLNPEAHKFLKSKAPGPIAGEALFRAKLPGAGHYKIPFEKSWDLQFESRLGRPDFTKAKRTMESDEIERRNKKKETSTPAPSHYEYDPTKFLPKSRNDTLLGL